MSLVLGVDGGNSKTLVMLADTDGRVLAAARAGCGNHQGIGVPAAMDAISGAIDDALHRAGRQGSDIGAACFALAGADFEEDFAVLRAGLWERRFAPRWDLYNDTMAALRSGTENRNAAAIVIGAGMNAAARNATGQEARYLALGWISGDWGGGGDIAQEGIRLAIQAWDGRGQPTILEEMILQALALPDVDTLIRTLYRREITPSTVLGLVPLILRAAEAGDSVAAGIVGRAGNEAAAMAIALLRRLDILDAAVDIVLAGSVLRAGSALFTGTIEEGIRPSVPRARIVVPRDEPVVGAVLGALDLAGVTVDATIRRRLGETATAALAAT